MKSDSYTDDDNDKDYEDDNQDFEIDQDSGESQKNQDQRSAKVESALKTNQDRES